jgi:hypothetical protein
MRQVEEQMHMETSGKRDWTDYLSTTGCMHHCKPFGTRSDGSAGKFKMFAAFSFPVTTLADPDGVIT